MLLPAMKTTLSLLAALALTGFGTRVNAQGTKPAPKSEENMETKKEEAVENSKSGKPRPHRAKMPHGKMAPKNKM